MSDPYLSALMYEAGVFAGYETRNTRHNIRNASGGPYNTLTSIFSLLTILVEVFTQSMLLFRTITAHSSVFNPSTILLIALSMAPALFRLAGSWLTAGRRGFSSQWRKMRIEEMSVKEMGRKGEYKQEIVLFGLKDWVLNRWESLKLVQMENDEMAKGQSNLIDLGLVLGQQSVETAFYVSHSIPITT